MDHSRDNMQQSFQEDQKTSLFQTPAHLNPETLLLEISKLKEFKSNLAEDRYNLCI